ncbi:MAG: SDR family NAD(P)-dependent oxidoreductase [Pantoea sp.]|nr:SDR family NAD(P)-dependent oxidoreductase [Pantoea sp.]
MKTWLITGASSGLGRLMCESLLARGDRVLASVRREAALDDMRTQYGDNLQVMVLDLSKTATIKPVVEAAFAQAGRIDIVVSNAAYGLFGAVEELSDTQIERQIATNLTGSIQLIRSVIPFMRQQGGGRIVQVSSEGGQIAYPDFSLYHATKWGIEGFVEALMSGEFAIKGDAKKCVAAMIAAADADSPALRLPLGSTAYNNIETALKMRLDALRAMKTVAYSADRPEM